METDSNLVLEAFKFNHEESQPTPTKKSYRDKFHYYVVFKKSIFFILGLILSYKLVEKTVLRILITHLADVWKKNYDLRRAHIVVNLREGTSSVLLPLFYYVAKVHTGNFRMVLFSTAVCIIGLFLNFMATRNEDDLPDLRLFYPSLLLIALAQAAQRMTLYAFLTDQLKDPDDTARRRRTIFWWILVSVVSSIFALIGPLPKLKFRKLVLALTAVMGGCFLLFLLGTKYYIFAPRVENPFKDVGTVINTAIDKRKEEYRQTREGYFLPTPEGLFDRDSSGDLHISPPVPCLRWLDKAAIITDIFQPGPPSVEQVRRVKFLLKMLPLWSSFLTFSLVAASGSTFFQEEATSLVADDDRRPIIFFNILMTFTESSVAWLLRKLGKRTQYNKQKMELVRVGIGMSCCVPCCFAAWATAARRQHGNEMSVYLLTPQYLLLGLMGGLARQGLESFYRSQVPKTLSRYGMPFAEFIMGVGKFLSILCILIFGRSRFKWFQSELKNSRLDKYYIFLAVLSFVNVIIYCLVARWYGDDAFLMEDVADDEEMAVIDQADELVHDGLASRSITGPGQPISHQSLSHRTQSSSGDIITESSSSKQEEEETPKEPILAVIDQADGLASRSFTGPGQPISHQSLSHRTQSSSGDIITESSSSKQEKEGEQEEEKEETKPLLANKNSKYINLLSMVTKFLRIFSKVAGKRSNSTLIKND